MGGNEREVPDITSEELWRLQKILSNKKGSPSQTFENNTETNAKVYDLNQKTMQALDALAAVYAVFEKAGENLNVENSTGDVLFADVLAAMDEQNQERTR